MLSTKSLLTNTLHKIRDGEDVNSIAILELNSTDYKAVLLLLKDKGYKYIPGTAKYFKEKTRAK